MGLASCGWLLKRIRGSFKNRGDKIPRGFRRTALSNHGLTFNKGDSDEQKADGLGSRWRVWRPGRLGTDREPGHVVRPGERDFRIGRGEGRRDPGRSAQPR